MLCWWIEYIYKHSGHKINLALTVWEVMDASEQAPALCFPGRQRRLNHQCLSTVPLVQCPTMKRKCSPLVIIKSCPYKYNQNECVKVVTSFFSVIPSFSIMSSGNNLSIEWNVYLQKCWRSFFSNNSLNTIKDTFVLVCWSLQRELNCK